MDHQAAGFSLACETCHNVNQWSSAAFDHGTTQFPLTGKHTTVACASCHTGGAFSATPQNCIGCHQLDFSQTTNPNHVTAGFPGTCETCHNTSSWQNANFDHTNFTGFALTGAHASVACKTCHVGGRFVDTPQTCVGCHAVDYDRTTNPNHRASNFPLQCESCHTKTEWKGASFDHSLARFPLTGKHTGVACASCHTGGQFTGTPTACVDCHRPAFDATTQPNHAAAGFPQTCETCHTTAQWTPAQFDHSGFPLTGKHADVTCTSCHVGGKFAELGTACASCHLPDFQKTTNPNHASAGFPQTCETCHTTTQWQGAVFDHNTTAFPLTGKHTATSCATCHVGGQFAGLGTACATCHLPDYQGTTNPNHASAGFPQTCETCHTTTQWQGAVFDHNTTAFPLTGKHTSATCASCHVGGQFSGLGTACATCHLPDYQGTTNPNHASAGFPQTCETCHTTTQWQGAVFDHNTTAFPLTGKHTATSCATCHVGGQFAGLGTACATCHLPDYQGTTNPNHASAGFPQTCETCHTTTQWQGAVFDHNTTAFPLTGKHTATSCATCHVGGQFAGLGTACATCHLPDYQGTTNPNHASAGFPQTCETCHTTTQWQGAVFDHNTTAFPLTGKHTGTSCATCHVGGQFAGLGTACATCHLPDYQGTTNPNHASAGFPQTCETCHTTTQWQGAVFDHNTTAFPLTGKHTAASCATCHVGGQFAGLGTACATCHLPDYQGTTNPNHASAGFPQTCETCHTTTQWQGAVFDHNTTAFPLTGKHTSATCASCHVGGQFSGLSTACATCHLPDYQGTTNPNHASAGFPQTCETCHTTTQWQGAEFDHNTTGFPLTGKHTSATCASCHVGGQFSGLGTACATCHLPDYQGTTNPNHAAAGFPQTCETCHTTTQWQGAVFDHNTTAFPLTGKHTSATCASCHVGGQFSGLGTACATCHLPDYQGTTNPNHAAAGFPQTCESCHTTSQWQGAAFDHNTATQFPLTGKHSTVACASCHVGGQFSGLGTACATCHLADYQGTSNPNHASAGFPQTCESCHTTTQWPGATFDHGITGFPLTGKHSTTTCASCHVGGQFSGLSTACVSCHLSDYQGTSNPDHVAAGFPQDCTLCHTTTQWPGATFNHSTTGFPLTGKHTTVACASCHVNNQFSGLSASCASCHLNDYQSTTNPNHVAAGFPQACETCHSTTQWSGATFNHSTTGFPLTGKHTTTSCASCHVGGVFQGTSQDCYGCHSGVYNSTTNPNHQAAGFPQSCDTCHTTTQWAGATFNHGGFPITSGNHRKGVWNTCADCHADTSNYGVFSCTTGCHPKSSTDSHHRGVRNYVYDSASCYRCHPNGRE